MSDFTCRRCERSRPREDLSFCTDSGRPSLYCRTCWAVMSAVNAISAALTALPSDADRIAALEDVLTNRCRQCLDYDPQGQFWCCYESRGDY